LAGQPVPDDLRLAQPTGGSDNAALLDSLRQRARQTIEAQEWARAVDLLSQASQLDPYNKEITEELVAVERRLQIDSLYKSGNRAMDSGRWEEAINHFNVITELEPGYKDTAELLATAHESLKVENKQQFITTRYQEGLAHFETERWQEAVEAFTHVQQVDPTYQQVQHLLTEAQKRSNPPWPQKLTRPLTRHLSRNVWRWGLVTAGIIAIIILSFLAFGTNNQVSGNDDARQRLKTLYEEVQQSIATGNTDEALAKLDLILSEDPDYADAAAIKRELIVALTPTLEAAPTLEKDPLAELIGQAQEAVDVGLWTEAIDILNELRRQDTEYEDARVNSLLCDAYVGRGVENLAGIKPEDNQKEIVELALVDFEAGQAKCPRRIDLVDQAERARAYLNALTLPESDYENLIPILAPIVAANSNYAGGHAKQRLYDAYLARAQNRRESPELIAVALSDYEAAIALNVADPSEAQTQRAELLLSFNKQPGQATPDEGTAQPTATVSSEQQPTPDQTPAVRATPVPAVQPAQMKYGQPQLIHPPNDTIFAGQFAEVFLEWEAVGGLAADEYYDLTIMHLFADQPDYTGSTRTRDTRVQINADIGVGKAGGDRFYWWVTVRKDNTAPSPGKLDLPLSPRSEAKTFIWSP
jgi:outer membrane protein assembly factor BamD (BamD/ComL family)